MMVGRQEKFAELVGRLLVWIYEHPGWGVTFGDASRMDMKGHSKNSYHYIRLAIDLNLFVDDLWMKDDCREWQAVGAYWLSLHPECSWGGRFQTGDIGDLNHFSFGEKPATTPKTVTA